MISTDKWVIRAVVIFLGSIAIIGMFGGLILIRPKSLLVTFVVGTVGTATGAMSALLAKTSTDQSNPNDPPQEVKVMNEPADPVPTIENTKGK